jgi:uncharacterized protein DUF1524
VLPKNPPAGWGNIDGELAEVYFDRFGNLALLQQSINSEIGNKSFSDKKPFLEQSSFTLTQKIALKSTWDVAAIDERQVELAELAVAAWPINV